MLLLKIVILQSFWFYCVLYAGNLPLYYSVAIALIIVLGNFLIFKPKVSPSQYIFVATLFTLFGVLHDMGLVTLGLITPESYSLSYLLLWPVFLGYYGDVLNKFQGKILLQFLFGLFGGTITYFSAYRLEAFTVPQESLAQYLLYTALFWGSFFPLSFKLFDNRDYWNLFLDMIPFITFDLTGFKRHRNFYESFKEDLNEVNKSKKALITGGSSGIGQALANHLSKQLDVTITGRNDKGNTSGDVLFCSLDLSDWKAIDQFCETACAFDHIILNAGGMPEDYTINNQGVEHQCASQLVGHYRLITKLKKNKKINKGAKIIWVSSGGMYLKKIDLENLFAQSNYDKVATYTNVKRAQVTLVEEMAKDPNWSDFQIYCMHPGWVKTPGLTGALPGFTKLINKRLRTPLQGADTIYWLLLTKSDLINGGFYFDRKSVSPYVHKSFIPSTQSRKELTAKINSYLIKGATCG